LVRSKPVIIKNKNSIMIKQDRDVLDWVQIICSLIGIIALLLTISQFPEYDFFDVNVEKIYESCHLQGDEGFATKLCVSRYDIKFPIFVNNSRDVSIFMGKTYAMFEIREEKTNTECYRRSDYIDCSFGNTSEKHFIVRIRYSEYYNTTVNSIHLSRDVFRQDEDTISISFTNHELIYPLKFFTIKYGYQGFNLTDVEEVIVESEDGTLRYASIGDEDISFYIDVLPSETKTYKINLVRRNG
jgi:hypothetical protein